MSPLRSSLVRIRQISSPKQLAYLALLPGLVCLLGPLTFAVKLDASTWAWAAAAINSPMECIWSLSSQIARALPLF